MVRNRARRFGFTLIELLVVIAIISLLISILLPALSGARKLSFMVREQASAQQHMVSWQNYATENRDAIFTGYIPWAVGHLNNQPTPLVWLHPDPWQPGYMVEGNAIKIAGLRWLGASGHPLDIHQLDRPTMAEFRTRPNNPSSTNPTWAPPTTLYDTDVGSLAAAMAYHPSLGGNYTFVGGNWSRGAFPNYTRGQGNTPANIGHPRPPTQAPIGGTQASKFYVTHVHEVIKPSSLLVWSSARGVDIKTTGSYSSTNYGRNPANWTASSRVVPGFWEVLPPRNGYPTNSTSPVWVTSNRFDERVPTNPTDWGFVHPRHDRRAVTAMVDGHVEMLNLEQLRDMRRWANKADRPDWNFKY